jgi:hypothetical protein
MEAATAVQQLLSTAVENATAGLSPLRERNHLAHWLERMIRRRTHGRVRDLKVEVGPEHIVLFGRSRSFYGKQLAQHAVIELVGHEPLKNKIAVD